MSIGMLILVSTRPVRPTCGVGACAVRGVRRAPCALGATGVMLSPRVRNDSERGSTTAKAWHASRCRSRIRAMNEVSQILSAIEQGDPSAAGQLLPLVYNELRKLAAQKLAQEQPGQTLQATALVHEAYLRMVGTGAEPRW